MLHVPQIKIIDTKSGTAVAYQLNYHVTLSDLETYEDLKTYFIRICADNEYIYTVFYGKEPWGLYDISCVNQIYIFDRNGNLIKKILIKHCIDNIAVDHVNKILYTTSPMDENYITSKRTMYSTVLFRIQHKRLCPGRNRLLLQADANLAN